jgi:hypothetical protein
MLPRGGVPLQARALHGGRRALRARAGAHAGIAELAWLAAFACYRRGDPAEAVYWAQLGLVFGLHEGKGSSVPRIGFRNPSALHEGPYDILRFAYRDLGDPAAAAAAEKAAGKIRPEGLGRAECLSSPAPLLSAKRRPVRCGAPSCHRRLDGRAQAHAAQSPAPIPRRSPSRVSSSRRAAASLRNIPRSLLVVVQEPAFFTPR